MGKLSEPNLRIRNAAICDLRFGALRRRREGGEFCRKGIRGAVPGWPTFWMRIKSFLFVLEMDNSCTCRRSVAVGACPRPGKLSLRTGTGWRAFFQFFFGPPGPYDFPGKLGKTISTTDSFLAFIFRGGPVLVCEFRFAVERSRKRASDPRPPHTRQEYEQKCEQNMAQNTSKQGKLDSFAAKCLF